MAEVKVGKKTFEVKAIDLDERVEMNNMLMKNMQNLTFDVWVSVIRQTTNMKDVEINDLSNDDIIQLAEACINSVNKKK